jgi:hypothetical protein
MRLRALLLAAWPAILSAQQTGTVIVAVHVTDSANVAVSDADVSVVRGLTGVLALGVTNAAGRIVLAVPASSETVQVTVRRIGFVRGFRFVSLKESSSDTMRLEMKLLRAPQPLEAVKVTAEQDLRRQSYYLTADDIENSNRTILDASDIFKLRPDMMTSRGGAKACEVPWTDRDGWIESVWVNGRRVVLPVVDSQYVAGRKAALGIGLPLPPRPNPRLTPLPKVPTPPKPPWTEFRHIDSVLSILHSIKPEHIAEVTYHDCFDASIGKNHSDMAMFIVLKPGIGYEDGLGSYVVAEDTTRRAQTLAVGDLPPYRFRLIGVYDDGNGDPLAGVDVIDAASGTRARTTATGTVSLFFLPEGANLIRLHHDGFRDTTVTLTISPRDTVPLTFVLSRQP